MSERKEVIVIGGGFAGIAAIKRLSEQPDFHVTLLEGSYKLGGRIMSVLTPGGSDIIELGAAYLHGEEGNSLYQFAKEMGLAVKECDLPSDHPTKALCLLSNGHEVSYEQVCHYGDIITDIFEEMIFCVKKNDWNFVIHPEKQERLKGETTRPNNVSEYVSYRFHSITQSDSYTTDSSVSNAILNYWLLIEAVSIGTNYSNDSDIDSYDDFEFPLGDENILLKCGYQGLVKILTHDISKECIKLNKCVSHVQWTQGNIHTSNDIPSHPIPVTYTPNDTPSHPIPVTYTPNDTPSHPIPVTGTPNDTPSHSIPVTCTPNDTPSHPIPVACTPSHSIRTPNDTPSHPIPVTCTPNDTPSHSIPVTCTPNDTPSHSIRTPYDIPSHPIPVTGTPNDTPSHSIPVTCTPNDTPSHSIRTPYDIPSHPIPVTGTPNDTPSHPIPVTCIPNDTLCPKSHPVLVTCSDGTCYPTDHVIVTVSLGVLKTGIQPSFNPPLPRNKLEAINRLGMGLVTNVAVTFQYPIVDKHISEIVFLWSEVDRNTVYDCPWVICQHAMYRIGNTNTWVTWFAGDDARTVESLSDDEVSKGISTTLKIFIKEVTTPIKIQRMNWNENKLFRGTYSYNLTGSDCKDRTLLSVPVNGCTPLQILFAGEATNCTMYSTTNGAYDTGIREAERLINYYKRKNVKNCM